LKESGLVQDIDVFNIFLVLNNPAALGDVLICAREPRITELV